MLSDEDIKAARTAAENWLKGDIAHGSKGTTLMAKALLALTDEAAPTGEDVSGAPGDIASRRFKFNAYRAIRNLVVNEFGVSRKSIEELVWKSVEEKVESFLRGQIADSVRFQRLVNTWLERLLRERLGQLVVHGEAKFTF